MRLSNFHALFLPYCYPTNTIYRLLCYFLIVFVAQTFGRFCVDNGHKLLDFCLIVCIDFQNTFRFNICIVCGILWELPSSLVVLSTQFQRFLSSTRWQLGDILANGPLGKGKLFVFWGLYQHNFICFNFSSLLFQESRLSLFYVENSWERRLFIGLC